METSQLRSYIVHNQAGMIELDLNGQDLRILPTELFDCLKIQVLKLSSNKLREIPKLISSLRQLRVLIASNNFLTGVPETLVNCTNLTEVDLENNRLMSLPVNLGLLNHLGILKLGQNRLESLTNEIGFLENLRDLDLHGNKLWYLPFSLGNLHKLRRLNLSENFFEHLPMPVCRIRSLVVLNLYGNQLISLAPDFENLRNLKELNLGLNKLKVVPPAICQMKELRYLNLAANQLTELPSKLAKLSKLQVLHSQQNYLETLPEALNNLRYLNVSQNHLRNFSIVGMKRLKYLNASKNLLDNTPMALFNISKLEHLKLNSNQITFLSQDIVLLRNLKTLDLGNNRLTNLPQVIHELQHLNFFNIKGNSVNTRLHPIICEQGQRDFGAGVEGEILPRRNRAKNLGHTTVTNRKDLKHVMGDDKLDRFGSQTIGHRSGIRANDEQAVGHMTQMWIQDEQTVGHRAGMWAHDELLQDGFSEQLLSDAQSCVIIENNAYVEGAEMNFPNDHYQHEDFYHGHEYFSRSNPDLAHMSENHLRGSDRVITKGKGSYSIRQHMKGRLSNKEKFLTEMMDEDIFQSTSSNTMSRTKPQVCKEHMNSEAANSNVTNFQERTNPKSTNHSAAISPLKDSLSSTDFKLLGVCSQLEAMLNEELLHPVLTHPGSISKKFRRKSIVKDQNGMWRLSQKDNLNQDELVLKENPTDTLALRSATPSRRQLVNAHSHGATFSPGKYREMRDPLPMEACGTSLNRENAAESYAYHAPAIRGRATPTDADFWHSPDSPLTIRHSKPVDTKIFYPEQTDFPPESQSFPSQPIHTRSNIDRYLLSNQGQTCISSVDPKVVVMVPKNGASRPTHLMMQLETISDETLESGQKDQQLIQNILSMSPLLHIITSQPIECHGMVTMTIPTPPGGKKGKFHLLTVRADNSCIPCTAGYHIKNGYLTLQTSHLSGKVVVCTKAKCKYKACKSVEQLLQFHYI